MFSPHLGLSLPHRLHTALLSPRYLPREVKTIGHYFQECFSVNDIFVNNKNEVTQSIPL